MTIRPRATLPRISRESLGVPSERDRYTLKRDLTIEKVNTLLLPTMRKHGIDMWIVLDREYHPDPLAREIGGRGGVRNAHIFYDNGETLEKIFIFSHGSRVDLVSMLYDELIHYGYRPEGLKPHLREVVQKRNPKKIGLNMSPTIPMADGLSVELKKYLDDAIGPELAAREVSAELVARDFRATRLPVETELYRKLVGWTVAWEEEGFSRVGITPGVTTPDDLHWWWRERALEIGLEICSFLPGLPRHPERLPQHDQRPERAVPARRRPEHRRRPPVRGVPHRHQADGVHPEARRDRGTGQPAEGVRRRQAGHRRAVRLHGARAPRAT